MGACDMVSGGRGMGAWPGAFDRPSAAATNWDGTEDGVRRGNSQVAWRQPCSYKGGRDFAVAFKP
jgi:hypothetical protein